jgi:hypothetical protein
MVYGDIPLDVARRSVDLLTQEVIPAIHDIEVTPWAPIRRISSRKIPYA